VLIGPGINPHNFSAVPSDLRVVERADIIFINGLGLEENVLDDIAATAAGYIVPVSDGIRIIGADEEADEHAHDEDEHDDDEHAHDDDEHDDDEHDDDEHAHEHAEGDPHVWMDPASAAVWVRNMVQVLSSADPTNTYAYQRNGNAYLEQLNELDTEIRAMISVIPLEKRKLVLDHQAFTYFAEAYDFEVTGAIIPGTTSNAEPSARDIAALSRLLKEEQVKAIFVGETASSNLKKLAETLTKEIGGNQEVRIMATLTGALALEGERGDTYLDLIRYNAEQVVNGLRE
jgi:ABC-type Zn uptake system ZnuABC Zn-binding protein ZnuA